MIAKTTGNNKKPTKHYREKKLGLIDRLSIALLKKQDTLVKDRHSKSRTEIMWKMSYSMIVSRLPENCTSLWTVPGSSGYFTFPVQNIPDPPKLLLLFRSVYHHLPEG